MKIRIAHHLVIFALVSAFVGGCAGSSHEVRSVSDGSAPSRPDYDTDDEYVATEAAGAPAPRDYPATQDPSPAVAAAPRVSAVEAARAEKERQLSIRTAEEQRKSAEESERRRAEVVGREASPELPTEPDPVTAEAYGEWGINDFVSPEKDPLSTFAIDVDTASYTIARRKLTEGALPPAASVRVEEFVNFFDYHYAPPTDRTMPFAVTFDAAPSPFRDDHVFLRVGVQGRTVAADERPPVHLTFLVDTSGSMQSDDKMGLVKQSLHLLVDNLRKGDTVALATYAGSVREVLAPTGLGDKAQVHAAIEQLSASGSTAMSSGLELAYKLAYKNLAPGHINRVIVCSDGDANVGPASHEQILEQIRHFTQEGVTLSTIGFGMGNYKDVMMEQLADNGNGNYYYIDSFAQAQKVFQDDLMGTLVVIAKDVKIQVEFDPTAVVAYRLIGYENRDIADKDFRNDAVDAGEIGAGHNVTALYELELREGGSARPATVRIRHKEPEGSRAAENTWAFSRESIRPSFAEANASFRFAVGVASFAELLRHSPFAREWSLGQVRAIARSASDKTAEQEELVALMDAAIRLTDAPAARR